MDSKNYRIIFLILIIQFIFHYFAAETLYAGVIIQDNFDNPVPENWNSGDGYFSPWNVKPTDNVSTCDGVSKHEGTIESSGRGGSGKSFRINKCNSASTGYTGYLMYNFRSLPLYKKLYTRMYIKIDPNWDAYLAGAQTNKWDRIYISNKAELFFGDAKPTDQARLEWKGSTIKNSQLTFYIIFNDHFEYATDKQFRTGIKFADYADGKWHCWEILLDLNGEAGIWVDGQSKWSINDQNWKPKSGVGIIKPISPAQGNLTDGHWTFPTNDWYALEFDDYVVSTSYIGPDESSSTSSSGSSSISSTSSSSGGTFDAPPAPGKPWVVD